MILFGSGRGGDLSSTRSSSWARSGGDLPPGGPGARSARRRHLDTRTLESLGTFEPEYVTATYTLYRGATVSDPVDGMHSFVPCLLRDDDQPRFPRPAVDLPGVVNPRSLQAASTRHRRLRSQPPRARHAPVVTGATGEMHGGPPVSCTATSTPSSRDSSHGQTHL
jgi:hypothetical protein